jgi:hypothetical protein
MCHRNPRRRIDSHQRKPSLTSKWDLLLGRSGVALLVRRLLLGGCHLHRSMHEALPARSCCRSPFPGETTSLRQCVCVHRMWVCSWSNSSVRNHFALAFRPFIIDARVAVGWLSTSGLLARRETEVWLTWPTYREKER